MLVVRASLSGLLGELRRDAVLGVYGKYCLRWFGYFVRKRDARFNLWRPAELMDSHVSGVPFKSHDR
jgi:hypothetical protein